MDYIDSFHQIYQYLIKIAKQTKYEEKDNDVKVTFEAEMSAFVAIGSIEWIKKCIHEKAYTIMTNYEGMNITYSNLSVKSFEANKVATLSLIFNKKLLLYSQNESILVYFDIKSFENKLNNFDLEFFQSFEQQKYIFLPINKEFSNGYINFLPLGDFNKHNSYSKNISEIDYKRSTVVQEIFSENNSEEIKIASPIQFRFNNISYENLQNSLNYCQVQLTMLHIANRRQTNKIIIKGYHNIELFINNYFVPKNTKYFSLLFDFVYDKEKYIDKIEITRNILTLYLQDKSQLETIDDLIERIYSSIKDHFTAYIQETIKDFFNQRKEIVKEAYSSAVEAKESADKLITNINLLVLGLVTAALTGIFAYSKGDKSIFILSLIFHAIYFLIHLFINFSSFKSKSKDIVTLFDKYVDQFSILKQLEIENIKQTYLNPSLEKLKTTFIGYICITIVLILIMIFTAVIFSNIEIPKKEDTVKYFVSLIILSNLP